MFSIHLVNFKGQSHLTLAHPCEILVIRRGEGLIGVSGQKVQVQPERIVFFCNQPSTELDGELEGYQLSFSQILLDLFLFKLQSPGYQWLYHLDNSCIDQPKLAFVFTLSLVEQIRLLLQEHRDIQLLESYLMTLLTHFNVKMELPHTDPDVVLMQRMLGLIELHFKEHRQTTFYALKMALTSETLNYLSWKYRDKRFFKVLMERLVMEADMLLLQPRWSIQDIAYELGFASHNHFSTYYLREKGYTPKEFRSRNQNLWDI